MGPQMTGPQMMGPKGQMTDEERQKFEGERQTEEVSREIQNIQREAKNFARDISRQKKDIERMTKKVGSTTCPAAAKAQALISEAEKAITELGSATAASWEDIEALRTKLENLRGGPNADVDEPIMQQFGNIMPQIGACEGLSQFVKEVQRFEKEISKDLSRETKKGGMDEETLAGMKEILAKLQALEKNPTEGLTEEDMQNGDFIRYLFEDNLQPLREQMDELRRGAGDKMSKMGVCNALQSVKKEVEKQAGYGEMSEEASSLLTEAQNLVTKGMSACDSKDFDTAQQVMFALEGLKQKADQLGFGDKGFNEKMEFGPQARDLLQGSIDDEELLKRLEEKLLSKMENQIKLITEAIQRQVADTLSKIVESKFIEITDALTKSLDNITYLSENAKNIALSNREQVTNVLGEIEGKKVSAKVENELKDVTEEALKQNWSTSAMAEIKNKLSDVASVASSETDALAAIEDLRSTIEEQKTEDIDNQVEAGLRPFKDTEPDAWFFGSAATLKDAGILKGTAEGAMDAGRNVALAEAAAMMLRGVGVEENAEASYKAKGVPAWADGVIGGLAEIGVDVANDPKVNFSEAASREEMAHIIVETLEKKGEINPDQFKCDLDFTDYDCSDPGAHDVSILIDLGVLKGYPDNTFKPDNDLNRAEAAAMVQRTMDAVQKE
ncbi:S-layer homology domain-containing protein [Candidatus Peregrinibacteria bacterium]|nr:S-layer homology domain-containing protein [Candidatus Peregrinibacteria bacterium]